MGARRGRSVGRHWWVGPRGAGRSCGGGSGGVAAAAAGLERSGGERRGAGREVAAPPGPMELENIVANTVLLKAREGERFPSSGRRPRWGGRPGAGRAALRPGAGGQGLPQRWDGLEPRWDGRAAPLREAALQPRLLPASCPQPFFRGAKRGKKVHFSPARRATTACTRAGLSRVPAALCQRGHGAGRSAGGAEGRGAEPIRDTSSG